jgi:hypothetical protein
MDEIYDGTYRGLKIDIDSVISEGKKYDERNLNAEEVS